MEHVWVVLDMDGGLDGIFSDGNKALSFKERNYPEFKLDEEQSNKDYKLYSHETTDSGVGYITVIKKRVI